MRSKRTPKEAVAYTRVSTEEQGIVGIGLEAQQAAIRAYADMADISIFEWFEDVASGRGEKNLVGRPNLIIAMGLAKKNKAALLVYSYDRLSRDSKTIDDIIQVRRVNVISVSDERTEDPLVLASRAARAELEGKLISERTKRALQDLKASGMVLGNQTNLPEAQKLGAAANVDRSEKKAIEIADAIRDHDLHHLTVRALADSLNALGIQTGRGKLWTVAALRRPHRAAMKALRKARLDDYQQHPGFGLF